jgi:polyhydroxybutyrate depolymerase
MNSSRRTVLGALAGACMSASAFAEEDGVLRDQSLRVNGARRRYRLTAAPDRTRNAPLVLALHGVADNPERMARYSRLDSTARSEGWVLAYPRSLGERWPYFSANAAQREIDFIAALIDELGTRYAIDPDRVHLTGMSGGGYFINVAASRLSERVASIAAHSGGAGGLALHGIHASRKYPVLVIHGDADRAVPIESGRALAALYRSEGHETALWEIAGLGHAWGAAHGVNARLATFFRDHPRLG